MCKLKTNTISVLFFYNYQFIIPPDIRLSNTHLPAQLPPARSLDSGPPVRSTPAGPNHPAHSNGTFVNILSCFIISSKIAHILLHENLHLSVFDLLDFFLDLGLMGDRKSVV